MSPKGPCVEHTWSPSGGNNLEGTRNFYEVIWAGGRESLGIWLWKLSLATRFISFISLSFLPHLSSHPIPSPPFLSPFLPSLFLYPVIFLFLSLSCLPWSKDTIPSCPALTKCSGPSKHAPSLLKLCDTRSFSPFKFFPEVFWSQLSKSN